MVMKKEEKKRNVRYSEGLVDDLCNFSRSDSRKRRGLWPGNKFPSFNLNQHVPQRNELRVQPDGRRQAVWAVPRARSTARGALEHEYEVARQFSQSRRHNYEQHAQPVGPVRGFAWAVWLYVVGMPPCDYLPIFATLNPQSTCHGPRAGPTLSPWCLGGLPACPGAESTRKDPRTEEKKMPMGKSKHISTW